MLSFTTISIILSIGGLLQRLSKIWACLFRRSLVVKHIPFTRGRNQHVVMKDELQRFALRMHLNMQEMSFKKPAGSSTIIGTHRPSSSLRVTLLSSVEGKHHIVMHFCCSILGLLRRRLEHR